MPIIKYISIHQYPMKLLEYVMRGDKTDECKFVTGMNCTANKVSCYDEMKSVFETCTGERFYKRSLDYKDDEQRIYFFSWLLNRSRGCYFQPLLGLKYLIYAFSSIYVADFLSFLISLPPISVFIL